MNAEVSQAGARRGMLNVLCEKDMPFKTCTLHAFVSKQTGSKQSYRIMEGEQLHLQLHIYAK